MAKTNEPVRLRQRKMPSGSTSLYLDIYLDGKRTYEYLKLYLKPENNRKDKEDNKQTLLLAEAVKAKRLVEVRNGKYGFENQFKIDTDFISYFTIMCEKRFGDDSKGNWGNWNSTLKHLKVYCKKGITFKDVTPQWIEGFKEYLETATTVRSTNKKNTTIAGKLSQNSKVSYFNKLCACIKQAYEEGIIPNNPLRGVERLKQEEVERPYLTIDEVRQMAATDCRYPALKRAFLFSCLTGLRKSDIEKMTWSEVRQQGEFTRIVFKQKKTGGQEYIDITPEALQFLGERGSDDDLVFDDFHYSAYLLTELRAWAMNSGVTKQITFHSGRHTFAVMMLDIGTDIYTVQKLLGHRMISTTMVYANIMDKKKQAAVQNIPKIGLEL